MREKISWARFKADVAAARANCSVHSWKPKIGAHSKMPSIIVGGRTGLGSNRTGGIRDRCVICAHRIRNATCVRFAGLQEVSVLRGRGDLSAALTSTSE